LINKILLALDNQPSSIYDILYSLTSYSDPRRTRLPKLLKAMEDDGLVKSALQPGPLGPYRRVYELGPEAESNMRHHLKNSLETILHFYDAYRKENPQKLYDFPNEMYNKRPAGKILFAAFPVMTTDDVELIREILISSEQSSISVLGASQILTKTGIKFDHLGDDATEITSESKTFSEVHFNGIPDLDELDKIVSECKRVMVRRGVLKINVPFAYFEDPVKPAIGEFIQITAANLFPELGVVEGTKVKEVLEKYFPKNGVCETSLGEVVFWAVKS
jgi:DNA-binding PadR family transcriptional regulator